MMKPCRRCGHDKAAHTHLRGGSDCALCFCDRYRKKWLHRPSEAAQSARYAIYLRSDAQLHPFAEGGTYGLEEARRIVRAWPGDQDLIICRVIPLT